MIQRTNFIKLLGLLAVFLLASCASHSDQPSYITDGPLTNRLAKYGLHKGGPVFIRIFKEERMLELWMRDNRGRYTHFSNYPICTYSGALGPKKQRGDQMAPEGFYQVGNGALNPYSSYYKSFNLGYPNNFDRFHGRTGDYLMVHGACVSVGCYAMTNEQMGEIYQLVESALKNGQAAINVHAFPFRMTTERMQREVRNDHYGFWLQLKKGYDAFEKQHKIPQVIAINGKYIVN